MKSPANEIPLASSLECSVHTRMCKGEDTVVTRGESGEVQ